jgi:hypothetical protein
MFNASSFCCHVTFVQFRSEILPLRNFGKYFLCAICSCDFVVRYRLFAICSDMSPSHDLDYEICALKW